MSSEDPFRLVMLAILVATVAMMIYFRLQAASSGERISRKHEGLLLAVSLRAAGPCLWIATLVYLIRPAAMGWAELSLPNWLRYSGAAVGAILVCLLYWTLCNLGKNLTDTVATRTGATLVTTGPYRWVRHPFYVCVGLLLLAVTLLTANWFIGLCGLVVMALLVARTPKEERMLVEKFGAQYQSYMASTGRFWPKTRSARR